MGIIVSSEQLKKQSKKKIKQIYLNLKRNHSKVIDMSLYGVIGNNC